MKIDEIGGDGGSHLLGQGIFGRAERSCKRLQCGVMEIETPGGELVEHGVACVGSGTGLLNIIEAGSSLHCKVLGHVNQGVVLRVWRSKRRVWGRNEIEFVSGRGACWQLSRPLCFCGVFQSKTYHVPWPKSDSECLMCAHQTAQRC